MTARRNSQQLSEESQCAYCSGSGVSDAYGYRRSCDQCAGSGLFKPPKMRAECECGAKQPRFTSAFTAEKWMCQHLHTHAPEEPEEF